MAAEIERTNRNCMPGYREMLDFFLPLALINISQSLTYPLVAMVATRGPEGAFNIAALAQASSVAFLIFTITTGMITAGMVFVRTIEGYRRYNELNFLFTVAVVMLHLFCCIPMIGHFIFGTLMGLPPRLEHLTYTAFVLVIPMSMIFNWRNPYMVILFNQKQTARAYVATFARISLTILFSFIFASTGLVGLYWAVFCLATPILAELFILRHYARPYILRLPSTNEKLISLKDMAFFSMSFSIGSVLISFCGYLIGAFAARAPMPETMLPVYYAALGLASPVCFGAARTQALVIAFARERGRNTRLMIFTCASGVILGLIPLLFLLPYINEWYYVFLQKLPPEHLVHIKRTALFLLLAPLTVALRSYSEGWAAFYRKPVSVISGQGVYLGAVVVVAFFTLQNGFAGNIIGPIALTIGNVCAMISIFLALNIETRGDFPVPKSTTAYAGE